MLVHFNDIVSKSRLYNASHDVCGFLMFDQRRFHQVLEGDSNEIDALFARIKVDQRHCNVTLLKREAIKKRTFASWSMGSFLNETAAHPLQIKHGLTCCDCVEPDKLLGFAHEFQAANVQVA